MKETALGIEAAGFESAAAIVHEQGIEKGKQRVHRIEWGTPGSAGDFDFRIMICEKVGKCGEVGGSGISLDAAQGIERRSTGNKTDADSQEIGGIREGVCALCGLPRLCSTGTTRPSG